MKILFISFEFPPQGGGIGHFIYQLALNAENHNISASVLCLSEKIEDYNKVISFDSEQKFSIIRFSLFTGKIKKIWHRISFGIKTVQAKNPDFIVIGHDRPIIIGLLANLFFNYKIIYIGHGSEFLSKKIFKKALLKLIIRRSNIVFLNSNYSKKLAGLAGINTKNHIILYPGADTHKFSDFNKTRQLFEEKWGGRFNILSVGTVSERKNQINTIKAVKSLIDQIPEIHLIIVGHGSASDSINEYISQEKLNDYITITGFTEDSQLIEYYSIADIFILNSKIDSHGSTEGFGIVLAEAGLMELPVIGIRDTGMEEVILDEKTGLLIPMNSIPDTINAILRLYNDIELRNRLGIEGKKYISSNFTWSHTTKKFYTRISDE